MAYILLETWIIICFKDKDFDLQQKLKLLKKIWLTLIDVIDKQTLSSQEITKKTKWLKVMWEN